MFITLNLASEILIYADLNRGYLVTFYMSEILNSKYYTHGLQTKHEIQPYFCQ